MTLENKERELFYLVWINGIAFSVSLNLLQMNPTSRPLFTKLCKRSDQFTRFPVTTIIEETGKLGERVFVAW